MMNNQQHEKADEEECVPLPQHRTTMAWRVAQNGDQECTLSWHEPPPIVPLPRNIYRSDAPPVPPTNQESVMSFFIRSGVYPMSPEFCATEAAAIASAPTPPACVTVGTPAATLPAQPCDTPSTRKQRHEAARRKK